MDILQHRTPPKRRSISDAATAGTGLAPSPTFNELPPRNAANRLSLSKDDHHVPTASPQTPKRPGFLGRGLSLQMPSRVMPLSLGTVASTNASKGPPAPAPLSPQLDTLTSYASPATSLPRHSRGLDFSRACTNLHHSTLAEQSSPDSSPVITQKAMGIGIPSRKASISSMMLDSPNLGPGSTWPQMSLNDRSTVSSSVGSVNMLASDSDSDSDDADLMDPDDDDPIYATPQAHKMNNHSALTPFAQSTASPGATWSNNFSPAHASLMKNFQRGRFRKERSRKSSSSASGASAMASPRTTSPPPLRSIESAGYFPFNRLASSRRESLALGTDQMNISSGNDSDGEGGPTVPTTPGVVRRAVTRRGNLLPKTKGFARIRAALMEESMPVDAEVKREAETIRQVRERDSDDIGASSPGFIPGASEGLEGIQEDASMGLDGQPSTHSRMGSMSGGNSGAPNMNFNLHASRNSAGLNYWNKFDKDLRTPPPPPSFSTRASSSLNGDINMDSPAGGGAGTDSNTARSASVVSMSDEQSMPFQQQQQQQSNTQQSNNNTDFARKFGKRRREDDFDLASAIKRRAVSPSLSSVNGSPVVNTASPARSELNNGGASNAFSRENTAPLPATLGLGGASSAASAIWGQPPKMNAMSSITRESSMGNGSALEPVRSNSGGSNTSGISMISSVFGGGGAANASTTNGSGNGASSSGNGGNPPKRIGLQGMVDTNDGIMNMSIE